MPGIGFLVIFDSFLESVLGPVAPKCDHFSRVVFSVFSGRRPEQYLGDFYSIFGSSLEAFSMFLHRAGKCVF